MGKVSNFIKHLAVGVGQDMMDAPSKVGALAVAGSILKSRQAGEGSDRTPKVSRIKKDTSREAYKKSKLPRGRI